MARDYKNSSSKEDKGKKRPAATSSKPQVEVAAKRGGMSPALSMAIGLGLGLAVAVYIYFKLQPQDGEIPQAPEIMIEPSSTTDSQKPVDDVEEGARFDFYSILPTLEVVIPDQEIYQQTDGSGEKQQIKAIKKPGRYLLQAGSFKKAVEAERVRAELALLGIESRIENVTINNTDTWHRVRIGPFDDNKKLDKVRNRLLDNGVDVMVLKVKS